ncbi:MAG TPA: MlaD family protein [Verrucomicrobiae bacterium]|jgi:phospholipid/cholesterol/gamma-HCH transport system substrate-binding protein|nr:MlaD family protein [Verrucomicrobiae bacterium]
MKYSAAEVKSGILITLSLVLFLALTFVVGGTMTGKTREWKVRFGYISGLELNAPVYFAGKEVGKVTDIEILSGDVRPVVLTAKISDKIILRKDTQGFIDTLGLMGEKFLELSPGTAGQPELTGGEAIPGLDPIPMHVMIRKMNMLADLMEELTRELNPMLKDMNGMLSGHQEEIAKTIANAQEISANIRDMTQDLKYHPWRLVRKG